ncbi:RPM1-interacting protein 4 [Selaginella moellendorffii]|uniref:RPM1-interacting protein 4 n=1 Tax=Selaginella moellendorffii TaxID=88036 RepID=UPI000D1C75F0|nr:RPM1-interacting protein 4 [Selaginella moellendorffii]|eukprot:XP_002985758.2 RPM1-interacting protein 4 [Selaginella moellendorffii]
MSRRTRIPKFGSWDSSDGNAAFTEVFEVARAARMTDPSEVLVARVRNPHPQKINPTVSHHHARKGSSSDDAGSSEGFGIGNGYGGGDGGGAPPRPHRQIDPPTQRILIDDSRYVPFGKDDGGPRLIGHSHSERESSSSPAFKSPLHQGRNGNHRSASPAWERKEGSSTPGRLRPKSSTNMEVPAPEKAAVLPKFGAWDANDPASGDGFTMIFTNARNEKKAGGSVHVPPLGVDEKDLYPERRTSASQKTSTKKSFCCFQPSTVEA